MTDEEDVESKTPKKENMSIENFTRDTIFAIRDHLSLASKRVAWLLSRSMEKNNKKKIELITNSWLLLWKDTKKVRDKMKLSKIITSEHYEHFPI